MRFLLFIIGFIFLFFKNKKQDLKRIISLGLCTFLLLFISGCNQKVSFEKYRNTNLEDTKRINEILSLLDIGKYKEKIENQTSIKPYSLTISLTNDMSIVHIYQKLEENALILFSLIPSVDEIIFERNGVNYSYCFENLNSLFNNNLHGISISSIQQRYEKEIFNGNGIYMGNINGYDIIDESVTCEEKKEFLKTEENTNYYLKCSDITMIYLYKNNEKYLFQEKINEFSMKDLLRTNLNIIKENVS